MLVGNLKTLSTQMAARWELDVDQCLAHARVAASGPDMAAVWQKVFQREANPATVDVDEDLYGGFVSNGDRRRLESLRTEAPPKLATLHPSFEDERLSHLLFRYRARNFPHTLAEEEQQAWEEHRAARLFDGAGGARTIDQLFAEIDALSETADERAEEILGALYDYAEMIAPSRY
jgi:exodeoxyribonuclease-1